MPLELSARTTYVVYNNTKKYFIFIFFSIHSVEVITSKLKTSNGRNYLNVFLFYQFIPLQYVFLVPAVASSRESDDNKIINSLYSIYLEEISAFKNISEISLVISIVIIQVWEFALTI